MRFFVMGYDDGNKLPARPPTMLAPPRALLGEGLVLPRSGSALPGAISILPWSKSVLPGSKSVLCGTRPTLLVSGSGSAPTGSESIFPGQSWSILSRPDLVVPGSKSVLPGSESIVPVSAAAVPSDSGNIPTTSESVPQRSRLTDRRSRQTENGAMRRRNAPTSSSPAPWPHPDEAIERSVQDDDGDDETLQSNPDCFVNAIKMTIQIGQVFSLLPADALTGRRSRWRVVYAALVCAGMAALSVLSLAAEVQHRVTLVGLMVVVFYGVNAVTGLLYIRLAGHWTHVLRAFRALERQHSPIKGLRRKLHVITILLLSTATVEHGLSEMNIIFSLRRRFPNASIFSEGLEIYCNDQYPMVKWAIGYGVPVPISPVLFFLNFTTTFVWNFNDLLIMIVSVSIAERFRIFQHSLTDVGDTRALKGTHSVMGSEFWGAARRTYNSLSDLTRVVDDALNVLLFVSFVNNLYFICMQLLRGFHSLETSWYSAMYICSSFSFLVVRTAAVSLFASCVRERSRSIKDTLYSVSSEDYNQEVYRFLVQVTSEDVALTGLNMFNVTRPLLLTVAGTILTYEVVLVQLH